MCGAAVSQASCSSRTAADLLQSDTVTILHTLSPPSLGGSCLSRLFEYSLKLDTYYVSQSRVKTALCFLHPHCSHSGVRRSEDILYRGLLAAADPADSAEIPGERSHPGSQCVDTDGLVKIDNKL